MKLATVEEVTNAWKLIRPLNLKQGVNDWSQAISIVNVYVYLESLLPSYLMRVTAIMHSCTMHWRTQILKQLSLDENMYLCPVCECLCCISLHSSSSSKDPQP